jgi:hypothetical protein
MLLLLTLQATVLQPAAILRRLPAAEARQGVAADARFIYAISNFEIGKYDRNSGKKVAAWRGDSTLFIHMNSCTLLGVELVCAASNYPDVPMASSVEWFDTVTMRHKRSRSLGPGRGSLTWLEWHEGSWWACFANYDGRGADAGRDHRSTVLVRFDKNFVEQEAWLFPTTVLQRFAPYSSSGGAWRDGLLYVTGHDRPEMYVLEIPKAGSRLLHRATIPIPTPGQAIQWDRSHRRTLWSLDRGQKELVESQVTGLPK